MTWVKVCGLTDPEDVVAAVNAGADAVGLVNVPASPRYLELHRAVELAGVVEGATPVLLTLDRRPEEILEILSTTDIGGVQPYGEFRLEAASVAAAAGYLVLFPTRPGADVDYQGIPGYPLLDTPSRTGLGGTGRAFDWTLAGGTDRDFVLAGGLSPANINAAIAAVRPWGVDASSGLEISPGKKDHGMVADFIKKAKET